MYEYEASSSSSNYLNSGTAAVNKYRTEHRVVKSYRKNKK